MQNKSYIFACCLALFAIGLVPSAVAMEPPKKASKKVKILESLDIHGNGKFTLVPLPYPHYKRKPEDHLQLIHQGCYKVYDITQAQNEVAVIGYLAPCVGIAVTDGKKLIVFHKFYHNSLSSMEELIREHLDTKNPSKLFAHIFTTRDDIDWEINARTFSHGDQNQADYVNGIKIHLCEALKFTPSNISSKIFNTLNKKKTKLFFSKQNIPIYGRYDFAALCVAVRLDELFQKNAFGHDEIKFASIDPFTEDVFNFSGTKIVTEIFGIREIIEYDKIPVTHESKAKNSYGYLQQRRLCAAQLEQEEKDLYMKHWGKTVSHASTELIHSAIDGEIFGQEITLKQLHDRLSEGNVDFFLTNLQKEKMDNVPRYYYNKVKFFPLP